RRHHTCRPGRRPVPTGTGRVTEAWRSAPRYVLRGRLQPVKNTLRKHLLPIALLALTAGPALAQATVESLQQNGITVATANEIPYGWVENGQAFGIAPEVATAVLESMGITNITWTVTELGSLIPGLIAARFDPVAASQAVLP